MLASLIAGVPGLCEAEEQGTGGSAVPPLVYPVENTGAGFPAPALPAMPELPTVAPLTDPFLFSDGSGRVTSFDGWGHRRAEIKAEIEHYEIGKKPGRPEQLSARYDGDRLTVTVGVNGESLTLTAAVSLPDGEGPFPAVIGIGRGSGSLPADLFESRGICMISFDFAQVMAHTQKRGHEPINRLYPDLVHIGAYSAWSWGVSRLIDGLGLVQDELPIDLRHLAVTGCSFAGKMALFAGAFDERIALTIAQEPGGGGAAAWRVSETLGKVEKLGSTSHAWFLDDMFQFSGSNVAKLPMDHHELMAMVAPRALLVLGNPDYTWLAEESGYVSCRAAHEVWKAFGIADRFGFSIVPGHGHCQLPDRQRPEVEAFLDKFLLGDAGADTDVTISPYGVDYSRWIEWWGSGTPEFPVRKLDGVETQFFEAEGATVGAGWEVCADQLASNGSYVAAKQGLQSIGAAPAGDGAALVIPFTVEADGDYALFARLNCPTADDDSFWVRVGDGRFGMFNGLVTQGWSWVKLDNLKLSAGENTLTISYREDGAKLDKICITNDLVPPVGMEGRAKNVDPSASQVLDFDLGGGVVGPYTDERGYGWERGGRRFSVRVPEGNHRVTVTLGNASAPATTTIKAELRRLMVENVTTGAGESKPVSFIVNTRQPGYGDGRVVRLKDRERRDEWLAWDDKLTLEFIETAPAVQHLKVEPAGGVPTIFILGDSTVCDQPAEPYASWGQMLPGFFGERVAIANHGESGESYSASSSRGRIDKVADAMEPGDYLFLQFAHNDMKERGEGKGAFLNYKLGMEEHIAAARARGGTPVLITPMHRRRFDAGGEIVNTFGDYPAAVRQTAEQLEVPLIDLLGMSEDLYEALGVEGSAALFKDGDRTHHNNYGAYQLAKCVIEGIRLELPELARSLGGHAAAYSPANPDPPDSFAVPASGRVTSKKPDGQ